MTVRIVKRRGKRRLVLDITYRKPDGSLGRFRRDAEVQMLAAARAEERRRLAVLVSTGSPSGEGAHPKQERPPERRAPGRRDPRAQVARHRSAGGQLVVRESLCRGQTASPKSGHERVVPLTAQLRQRYAHVARVDLREAIERLAGESW